MTALDKALNEMAAWLPSETETYKDLIYDILTGMGFHNRDDLEPVKDHNIGWKEADLLGQLLVAIQNTEDLNHVLNTLYPKEEEPEVSVSSATHEQEKADIE